jgi:D-psicose/D-tagatose/L-ribulose 3-epimerase
MSGQFGVHSLVFTDDWSEASAARACRAAREIGYDLIEVLIFDPATLDVAMTARVARDAGIGLRLGMALGPETDIAATDAETAARGEATVARCLEIAADLGAPAVSGITYAAFSSYRAAPTAAQRDQVAASLARLDARAGALGVRLGLEPVNRYESYLVNTLDEGADLIRRAGGRNLFLHMDTFHMNIEEADLSATVHRNAGLLGYVHLADNHRARLGTGTFDLAGFLRALASAGYSGDYTVESFSPVALSADLAAGLRLWRTGWQDPVATAREALATMRLGVAEARAAAMAW